MLRHLRTLVVLLLISSVAPLSAHQSAVASIAAGASSSRCPYEQIAAAEAAPHPSRSSAVVVLGSAPQGSSFAGQSSPEIFP